MIPGPVCYAVDAPRSNELAAWLKCNDVDPSDVPYPSRIFVETADGTDWVIRYDAYVRSASGMLRFDFASETFEYTEAVVPLVNDPPMWWLKGTAPSGLQGTEEAVGLSKSPQNSEETVADGACNFD